MNYVITNSCEVLDQTLGGLLVVNDKKVFSVLRENGLITTANSVVLKRESENHEWFKDFYAPTIIIKDDESVFDYEELLSSFIDE